MKAHVLHMLEMGDKKMKEDPLKISSTLRYSLLHSPEPLNEKCYKIFWY